LGGWGLCKIEEGRYVVAREMGCWEIIKNGCKKLNLKLVGFFVGSLRETLEDSYSLDVKNLNREHLPSPLK
jgi:hypothetical protein